MNTPLVAPLFHFSDLGRLPEPDDNVAIAIQDIEPDQQCVSPSAEQTRISFRHDILEGHRFAIHPIASGDPLLSWGLPFGWATAPIQPGDYVCNEKILAVLRERAPHLSLPTTPNFKDHFQPCKAYLPTADTRVTPPPTPSELQFEGFDRGPERGVGTRNALVILGISSLASSLVRKLAQRFALHLESEADRPFDNVVGVSHTEGGTLNLSNNRDLVLRTLAGFMIHPNVGAVLAIDSGIEDVNGNALLGFLREHHYPIDHVPHAFLSIGNNFADCERKAASVLSDWLNQSTPTKRTSQPLSRLKIALQCGGSDAFSGISGNPLAGVLAKRIIQDGGSANLAETDELIGAESYILQNVKDHDTALQFLKRIERFETWAGWHGHSGASNPSGGNNYRGLYNIAIKSIGAARKKDPDVCLDYVIDYAERMKDCGFHFMDSPGNDLESIAGQVASGCNLILFITGNGSITNFPFVPTLKIVTTSRRFELLKEEMDINAGLYQDGMSMEDLSAQALKTLIKTASGSLTAGEKAGHSQVQIWRDWHQTDDSNLNIQGRKGVTPQPPLEIQPSVLDPDLLQWARTLNQLKPVIQSNLIVPTSLCSGQVGHVITQLLNSKRPDTGNKWVCLAHTEGCGSSDAELERMQLRTLTGYLIHPLVNRSILLEHGCEKTHNQRFQSFLNENHINPDQFGWAGIQADGGMARVTEKIFHWVESNKAPITHPHPDAHILGILTPENLPDDLCHVINLLVGHLLDTGGSLVLPSNSSYWIHPECLIKSKPPANLPYGQYLTEPGLYSMDTPTHHQVETVSGLAASGCKQILIFTDGRFVVQGNPLVPTLSVILSDSSAPEKTGLADLTWSINSEDPKTVCGNVLRKCIELMQVTTGTISEKLASTDFQLTRGHFGVSL